MKDDLRKDLKQLCYQIIENPQPDALPDQLSQVQSLYERLLLLNFLEEKESGNASGAQKNVHTAAVEKDAPPPPSPVPETLNPFPEPRIDPSDTPSPRKALKPDLGPIAPSHPRKDTRHRESASYHTEARKPQEPPVKPSISERAEADQKPSLNDRLAKGSVQIGLNDRLAFVKHLFEGNQEDFNRVLSQLNTFEAYEEAAQFLERMVKPDYHWEDKEVYEARLREILLKSFGEH